MNASRIVKQIDTYDIWQDPDGSYTVNAEEGGHTRLVANVDSLKSAIRQVRIHMMGER